MHPSLFFPIAYDYQYLNLNIGTKLAAAIHECSKSSDNQL